MKDGIDIFGFGLLATCLPLALIIPWIWLFVSTTIATALILNAVILLISGLLIVMVNAPPAVKPISTISPAPKLTSAVFRPLPRYETAADLKPTSNLRSHTGVAGLEFDEHGNLIV